MRTLKWFLLIMVLSISIASVTAQQCLSIVTEALEKASAECALTGRNEACYGYNLVTALPNFDPSNFVFDNQGDIAPFDQIGVMELSAFNEDEGQWGVVIARIQAQIPDTLPGQNVTMIFFGSVGVENQGVDEGGIQAFRFESGIQSARCFGLPPDGIIVDTPEGSSLLTFTFNGVEVSLGSTAYFQTVEDGDDLALRVGMFEGTGFISAEGGTTRIEDGQQTMIPLDANLQAAGPPTDAEPFDASGLTIMFAYAHDLEFADAPDSTEPEPTPTVYLTPIPCTVSTTETYGAGLRVGPGENRTRRAWMPTFREIPVTGVSEDGEWWQVDKFEAFPSGANSVNELWVRVDQVTEQGDCDAVGEADAPPIVAPPPPAPPTPETNGPTPTPDPGAPMPIIEYWADPDTIDLDSCSNINWHVEYVSAMHLYGPDIGTVPLAGITGSYEVCPMETTTYYLQITHMDGSREDFPIMVTVDSGMTGQLFLPTDLQIATPIP